METTKQLRHADFKGGGLDKKGPYARYGSILSLLVAIPFEASRPNRV